MTADQFSDAANPAEAQRMIENIRAIYARGLEALQAEQDNPEMTTKRIAAERKNVPVQQIRRDKQFAQVFSERELEQACRLRQPDGMPLQWGHLNKVFSIRTSKERLRWLRKAAKHGWPVDVLSRQITGETGHSGAHGRGIKQPSSIEDGLNQLVRNRERWLRRMDVLMELINDNVAPESPGNNLADALEGLLNNQSNKKRHRALLGELQPKVEGLLEVLTKMRSACTPAMMRKLQELVATQ